MAAVAAAAHAKVIKLRGLTVVASEDAETYQVITAEQMQKMPFCPDKWSRGRTAYERSMLAIWDTFEDPEGSSLSNIVNGWIMLLIIGSAVVAVVETIPSIHKSRESTWDALETFFVANFTLEFVLKLVSCPTCREFWTTGMNYVDLIAILPFYVDLLYLGITGSDNGLDLAFLRILRLGRAFRLVKLGRYSQGVRLVTNAMASSLDALNLFALVLVLVVVVFSSAIYYFERGEWNEHQELYYRKDPDTGEFETTPSTFQSIPACFWWCVATLTTVGYGDLYPYTSGGKVMGAITILVGLVMLALPLSILGTNFVEERQKMLEANAEEGEVSKMEPVGVISVLAEMQGEVVEMTDMVDELKCKVEAARKATEALMHHKPWFGAPKQMQNQQSKQDVEEDVKDKDDPNLLRTCELPDELVEAFQDACAELLMSSIVFKDRFDPGSNGLESLPHYVRDQILPSISSELTRPFILEGADKLLVPGCSISLASTDVVEVSNPSDESTVNTAKVHPIDSEENAEGSIPS